MDLDRATLLAGRIARCLDTRRETEKIVVGSIRRKEARIGDIDILVVSPRYSQNTLPDMEVRESKFFSVVRWISRGTRRSSFVAEFPLGFGKGTIQCDIFYATRKELPFALLHCTGSKDYLIRMRYIASLRGLRLNQYGIEKKDGGELSRRFRSEGEVQEYLGMSRRPPWDRH